VQSTFGVGSQFVFILPVNEIGAKSATDSSESTSDAQATVSSKVEVGDKPLSGVRILLAEDGIDNQKLIAFHLSKAGADVTIAQNGKEAVQTLTIDGTLDGPLMMPCPFDLLLTDMQMPEMDGYSATRLLRSKDCGLPIIALTANAMLSDVQMCINAGCNEHVSKPVNSKQLIETCVQWAQTPSKCITLEGLSGSFPNQPASG
jgi:CheY-like chemotaxis protein